jgi:CheY-like chemotaxis protein
MAPSEFTVFLIDDDPGVLRSLDRLLQAAGYETKALLATPLKPAHARVFPSAKTKFH